MNDWFDKIAPEKGGHVGRMLASFDGYVLEVFGCTIWDGITSFATGWDEKMSSCTKLIIRQEFRNFCDDFCKIVALYI